MYLKNSKKIVIKIGSSLLIDKSKKIRLKWLTEFSKDIKELINQNKKIIIVQISIYRFCDHRHNDKVLSSVN